MNLVINILSLDIGRKRIGVARANSVAKIAEPLTVLPNNENFTTELDKIVSDYSINNIVVGLPRGLSGQETEQSSYTRQFVSDNIQKIPVKFQDETLSSVEANKRMELYGLKDKPQMLDAVAACIILEDYLNYENC